MTFYNCIFDSPLDFFMPGKIVGYPQWRPIEKYSTYGELLSSRCIQFNLEPVSVIRKPADFQEPPPTHRWRTLNHIQWSSKICYMNASSVTWIHTNVYHGCGVLAPPAVTDFWRHSTIPFPTIPLPWRNPPLVILQTNIAWRVQSTEFLVHLLIADLLLLGDLWNLKTVAQADAPLLIANVNNTLQYKLFREFLSSELFDQGFSPGQHFPLNF